MEAPAQSLNRKIKSLALAQGFCACGITRPDYLGQDAGLLARWLSEGKHGEMGYMARNVEKRLDARLLVEGARSIVCLAHPYLTPRSGDIARRTGVARYALGEDYHAVLKDKMHALCAELHKDTGVFSYRAFTDSAPLAERRLGQLAGLGWIGKNSMLILPGAGSYVLLSEIVTDLDIALDEPFSANRCGACRRCRMACPTGAIDGSGNIDARRCISYATIELKGDIPPETASRLGGRVAGCDACLEACPWNKKAPMTAEKRFFPLPAFENLTRNGWREMGAAAFGAEFALSALQRAGLDKIKAAAGVGEKNLAEEGF